ncbi:hypothetical protein LPB67_10815 [Undibacterium sp. Jales W-56]|uniref:hypothetical protein n=1 Tax=Undibacterium sp. Jales W-56 TaxID=2897325 RepID=UPI0021D28265|nr:hypothetical protein [Undibacterium sp. Jales W-56]MCU6434262.1 hypothetical protein [Undibacterium sp. Jales W-56]
MPSFAQVLSRHFLIFGLLFCSATTSFGAAHIPASDATVLERLPFKPNDPVARELAQMRAELQRNPTSLEVAVKLAHRYYGMVGEEGDPRYLGYAQAALAPWWEMPRPPVEVQVLRAGLLQFRHDFSGAIADLDSILARNPRHPQARVLRAVIEIVQASYDQARTDCRALQGLTSDLIAIGCEAMVDGLTGKVADAYTTLLGAYSSAKNVAPDVQLWVLTRLAELSQRQGKIALTETHFKQALALGISDTFLFAAYADFLLDQQRPAEVVALLKDKTRSDTLLLRLVFAERRLNLPAAKEREATLAARYVAAQLRGDTVHQQEEARFALQVQNNPKKALALAQENWKVQLEPRDARIFLEAALTLKDPHAAQPVLHWLANSRIEDAYLIRLGQQLTALQAAPQ